MKSNFCIRDLVEITGGRLQLGAMPPLGGELQPLGRVVVDCREIRPGDVYWSLERDNLDAGLPEEAFARAALGVVTAGRRVEPWAGKFAIQVDDSQAALKQLVRAVRSRFQGFLVAVTGHTGKTTTAAWIESALAARGLGYRVDSNGASTFDPRTLLELTPEHRFGIFELTDDAPQSFAEQARWLAPHAAVLLSADTGVISPLDQKVATERIQTLRDALPTDGTIVVNGDDELLARVLPRFCPQILRVGRGSRCEWAASDIRLADGWLDFVVEGTPLRVRAAGRHALHSALAAFALGRIAGISADELAARLETAPVMPDACSLFAGGPCTVIVDTPRGRPRAAHAALAALRDARARGRRILFAGDIFSAHPDADLLTKQMAQAAVARHGVDQIIGFGARAELLAAAARDAGLGARHVAAFTNRDEASAHVRRQITHADALLILGTDAEETRRLATNLSSTDASAAA